MAARLKAPYGRVYQHVRRMREEGLLEEVGQIKHGHKPAMTYGTNIPGYVVRFERRGAVVEIPDPVPR